MKVTSREFGNKIRELRLEKGFSVSKTPLRTGVSQPYLSQVENTQKYTYTNNA